MTIAQRQPIPPAIQNAPELMDGLNFYYEAFKVLGTTRSVGMGIGPIPWTAMYTYFQAYELPGELFDDFVELLRYLDGVYIEFQSEKTSKSTPPTGKKRGNRS